MRLWLKAVGFGVLLMGCPKLIPVEPGFICETRCGLKLLGPLPTPSVEFPGPPWSCEEFQRAENATLQAFKLYVKASERTGNFTKACTQLRGWGVFLRPEAYFTNASGQRISGITFCQYQRTDLGNRPWADSSLTHEMMHVVQRCNAPLRDGDSDSLEHGGWDETGLRDAEWWIREGQWKVDAGVVF